MERASTIQAVHTLLLLDTKIVERSTIEKVLQNTTTSPFDYIRFSSIDSISNYLKQNNCPTTILFYCAMFEEQEQQTLAKLVSLFPKKNIILVSKEDRIEIGLTAIEIGAKDYISLEEATADKISRVVQFAEQRNQKQLRDQHEAVKSQDRYQDIVNHSKDAIYVCDLEGNVVDFNPATAALLGLAVDVLPNIDIHNLMHSTKRRKEFLVRLVAGKKVENFEIEIERTNGERRQCIISAHMMEYPDFRGYNGIIRDITEQKQAEALKKARKLAKESAEMKEEFLASISHEMRTPMNAILGMSNLVLKTDLNDEQTKYVSSIKQSSEILLGVVNDILQISELQNGKIKFENKDFDLHALMNNLINVMQYKAKEKNLLIELVMDEGTPKSIRGDKLRLNQILYNLVGNAIKFTDEGHVKIFVVNLNQNNYSVQIKFLVEDTGIGIPDAKKEAIFESFTRIRTKDRIFEGTGLGLSIAKNLIEHQGGKIGVTSEVNKGSTFFFDLIFEIGEELVTAEEKYQIPLIDENSSFRLLLVEDHKMNQLVARKTLEKKWKNIQLTIANDGQEAIAILDKKSFDIILMDLQMPIMNGYETTEYIREKMAPEIATLPILAMTAHAHISQDEKFKEYGMDDFVLKPFEPAQLFKKISQYVIKKRRLIR